MPNKNRSQKTPKAQDTGEGPSTANAATGWRAYRQEITFLTVFILVLGGGFTLISLNSVNDAFVEPFTGMIAKASGITLNLIGQDIQMRGTAISNRRFGVNIRNGCNGLETMIIFLAAVLAFPASWKARIVGLIFGAVTIQGINLVRVVALFLTGAYYPKFFDSSHTVVWQTIVILFGVMMWILWAQRVTVSSTPQEAAKE